MATKTTTLKTGDVSILKHPRITEKTANAQALRAYTFDVSVDATKSEITKAFITQYKQTPVSVRTLNSKPKSFFRKGRLGFGPRRKKAYITLPKGKSIDII